MSHYVQRVLTRHNTLYKGVGAAPASPAMAGPLLSTRHTHKLEHACARASIVCHMCVAIIIWLLVRLPFSSLKTRTNSEHRMTIFGTFSVLDM